MIAEPRPYRSAADLPRMMAVLAAGRLAQTGTYYVHHGDVCWWLGYLLREKPWEQMITLWEDEEIPGGLAGWALLDPTYPSCDVVVHPALRGSKQAVEMLAWGIARLEQDAAAPGDTAIHIGWVAEHDDALGPLLAGWGFSGTPSLIAYTRPLDALPEVTLPPGFSAQTVGGEADAERRARASHGAFGSSRPFPAYLERYRGFMGSALYDPESDMMITAPEGRAAAFCIAWIDPATRTGLFEPVGTHPDFQGRGLGRAMLAEGMRRMQARGMTQAIVCAEVDNLAAQGLYRSVGFEAVTRLYDFTRPIVRR
ncbi:MAG: hypothetical protein Kow00124_14260 [Anaerolineae bacterium]